MCCAQPDGYLSPDEIMARWRPGSHDEPWSWRDERDWLWKRPEMDALMSSIQIAGVLVPVLLGDDGRVWDGHHRIVAALDLGIPEIPYSLGHTDG